MSCAACAARVETKLNRQPGVHASVNFATGVATIDAPGSLDEDALCEVVTKAGYEASPHVEG
ncbi:MAG TPA: heavy metal-associated domain-containing protein, partial [Mycobacterium sp.]|nr:heavy metal-associated domain-containing protein [Mycobacterium sp.]